VRTGVEVKRVVRNSDRPGFTIETNQGVIHANRVVAATGPFQKPVIPAIAPKDEPAPDPLGRLLQPEQLPEGAVLVVGAGSSGVQIAEELMRAGRQVYLSVGAHDRPPRSYRNRDFCWWLGVLGEWDAEIAKPGREHVTIAGQRRPRRPHRGLPRLAHQGMTLVGLTQSFEGGVARFQDNLADNINRGDENYLALLDAADAYIERNGLDLPANPKPASACPTRLRQQPAARTGPGQGRRHQHHLGHRLRRGLQLAAGRCLRCQRQAPAPARRVPRAGRVLPRPALAVAPWLVVHLGRVARRQARRRPHRHPTHLPAYRDRDQRTADEQNISISNVSTLGAH
jgi:putative flavoprotein involved in K+ transport